MRKFYKTVIIVTIFSLCEKFLGFLYRIFLSHTIGSEGIGVYQIAISVFALLLTIICAGTPVTVSRLMTKYKAENNLKAEQKVISAGIIFTFIIACIVTALCYILTPLWNIIFANPHATKIFLVILPGLIFTSVYSVLRGVFWGNKDFLPYSIIELLEEISMIIIGIVLVKGATDAYDGAFRAGFAVLISFIFSFSLSLIMFFVRKNKLVNPIGQLKPLLKSATPITAMRTANSLISSLISVLLPLRLVASGMSNSEAMSAIGSALGQAYPMLCAPINLVGALSLVLIPEISDNFYRKNYKYLKNDIEKSFKFAVFISAVFVPPLTVSGQELGVLVFNSVGSGNFLSSSAFLVIFLGASNLTTSILNSIGLENKTLLCFICVSVLMILSVVFLPQLMGIYALLVGDFLVAILTTIFNIHLINKNCLVKPKLISFLIKSCLLQLPLILVGLMLEKMLITYLGSLFTTIILVIVLMSIDTLLFVGFNLISFSEIKEKIPFLNKKKQLATR